MTAVNQATQIPNAIATLEQIALWSLIGLNQLNNASQFQLADNEPLRPVIAASHFNDAGNQRRIGFFVYFSVDPAYDYDKTLKIWLRANEFTTAVLPTGFTTN